MSNAQHSYNRSFPLPRHFPVGSLDEALRVIDEARATNPILAAKSKHIDLTLAAVARLRRAGGL
jgi:hypothetical protein